MSELRFMCGRCGERFSTKKAKGAHKSSCRPSKQLSDEPCHDEDLYSRVRIPAHLKRLADAEWLAMDNEGRLPDGWVQPEEELR